MFNKQSNLENIVDVFLAHQGFVKRCGSDYKSEPTRGFVKRCGSDYKSEPTRYLFLPGNNEKFLKKAFGSLTEETNVIIDIEDAVADFFDQQKTKNLKNTARAVVANFLKENTIDNQFYIRINNAFSDYYQDDRSFLLEISKLTEQPFNIILPKVNSATEMQELAEYLKQHSVKSSVIPLIETKQGMNDLGTIVDLKPEALIFGHHDYFYDVGVYPIPQSALTSKEYRNILRKIIDIIRDRNKDCEFIDGIYPELYNQHGMQNNCRYLYQEFNDIRLGKLALNPQQVEAVHGLDDLSREVKIDNTDAELSNEQKSEIARRVVSFYEDAPVGVARAGEQYFSPQQYLGSKRFMEQEEKNFEFRRELINR